MQFSELGLNADILSALNDKGYVSPTPIQAQAIPSILAGRDIMAGAQTGTGKTAAFTLPILHKLDAAAAHAKQPRALVLTPTRELAAQVGESVETYGKKLALKSTVIFGGVNINPQKERLRKGMDIVIATPGRLLDHANQKTVDLSKIEVLVLDEADRMLDMGFIHDIKKVIRLLSRKRQNLLFSATYSDEIKGLADGLLHKPEVIEVAKRNATAETITQAVYQLRSDHKFSLLAHLIRTEDWYQALVFTRTKHGANRLAKKLNGEGIPSDAIHGNKSQNARTRALENFKSGDLQVLVATDIAARGLDIDKLPHVVNYELPNVPEDYVHRIGRTGRAGSDGVALSLVAEDEMIYLRSIERLVKQKLTVLELPEFKVKGARPHQQKPQPAKSGVRKRPNSRKNQARKAAQEGTDNGNQSSNAKSSPRAKTEQTAARQRKPQNSPKPNQSASNHRGNEESSEKPKRRRFRPRNGNNSNRDAANYSGNRRSR